MRFSKDACQYRRQIFGRNSEALKPALKAEDGKAALDEARMTFSSLENSMSLMRRQVQAPLPGLVENFRTTGETSIAFAHSGGKTGDNDLILKSKCSPSGCIEEV